MASTSQKRESAPNGGQPAAKVLKEVKLEDFNGETEFSSQQTWALSANGGWDPFGELQAELSGLAKSRAVRDIQEICKDPPPGMQVLVERNDISRIHLLISGPADTPYDGGFFEFFVRITPEYPFSSPKVRHLTTAGGIPQVFKCLPAFFAPCLLSKK